MGYLGIKDGVIMTNTNGAIIGETGTLSINQLDGNAFVRFNYKKNRYQEPIIIMQLQSRLGKQATHSPFCPCGQRKNHLPA